MLQFHVELCCVESNVVHKVRRYIQLFVASELVSDVEVTLGGLARDRPSKSRKRPRHYSTSRSMICNRSCEPSPEIRKKSYTPSS